MGGDGVDLLPRDPHRATTTKPTEEPSEEPRALSPDARAAQKGHDLERAARIALELEVVDVAAPPALGVEELMIDEVQPDVDRSTQFWPTFVRIINGIADTATTRMTTR